MSKLLELNISNGQISGNDTNGNTYSLINKNDALVNISGNQYTLDGSTAKYGYVDLNAFHDTNRAFTIEFTMSDTNVANNTKYNYMTIGNKTYSQLYDAITIGVSNGVIVLGVVTHDATIKLVPLSAVSNGFTNARFQFNYDPNQSIRNRATLYMNDLLICRFTDVLDFTNVNILDFVIFFGTTGTTNESGYNNKMDLAKNIVFTDKISIYSGITMDKLSTNFNHVTFSNATNHLTDICNNQSTQIIHAVFKTNNDLIEGNDLRVSLSNAHDSQFSNVGEFVSINNNLQMNFKFSNLDKLTTTNTFLKYNIEYLGKQYSINPVSNKMYVDSTAPTVDYKITYIGASNIRFTIDAINDGSYATDTGKSTFNDYNVTFFAKSNNLTVASLSVDDPTLNTTYELTGLDDGVYYNISASVTDTVSNTTASNLPIEINTNLLRHYTNTKIRTTDITAPGDFTMAIDVSRTSGLTHGFKLTNMSENAVVDVANPMKLYYLVTDVPLANDNAIKTAVVSNGTLQTFTTATSTFDVPASNKLTNGEDIQADKYIYFYAMLKDSDDNVTLAKTSALSTTLRFHVDNSITFVSMVSNFTANTSIASETNSVTITFQSTYKVHSSIVSDFRIDINSDTAVAAPNFQIATTDNLTFTITYALSNNVNNETYDGYVAATVKLPASRLDNPVPVRTLTNNNSVLLRGSSVPNVSGLFQTNVFTVLNGNDITSTNYLNVINLLAEDSIIAKTSNVDLMIKLFDASNNIINTATKSFQNAKYADLPTTISFNSLDEGFTYNVKIDVSNDLGQNYVIRLEEGIKTSNFDPITTSFSTVDAIMNNRPSIQLSGLVANDLNSEYDIYLAVLHSNVFELNENNIKTFFINTPNTKRFQNVAQNTPTNVVSSKLTMLNADGLFNVDGAAPKVVKSYDGATSNIVDIPIDTASLTFIGMIRDYAFDSNLITFSSVHNYTYTIQDIAIVNNKNTSSSFVKSDDQLAISWKTNYQTSAERLSLKLYTVDQSFTQTNFTQWSSTMTIPSTGVTNETFVKDNLLLKLNTRPTPETIVSTLQIDSVAPVWDFFNVYDVDDSNITMNIKLTYDVASNEKMKFVFEASNDGSNDTGEDVGKTFITSNIILDFSSISTQTATLSGLSPGLDYFIKGQLFDANSNALPKKTYVQPNVNKGVVFTTDSILPEILNTPVATATLSNVTVNGLQVGDSNSIYSYYVGVAIKSDAVTFDNLVNAKNFGANVFSSNNIPRGVASTLNTVTFTTDKNSNAITTGTEYNVHVMVRDADNNEASVIIPFITEYPVDTSDVVDSSGTGGVLTHFFNYDLLSLNNNIGPPHATTEGVGSVTFVPGFVGSNAVFLNSNVGDNHSLKVSSVSMSNHEEFSFATWLKSHNTDSLTAYKSLFYYDAEHYLRVKDQSVIARWGATSNVSSVMMEYSSNDWNHLAMTVDTVSSSSINVYWNGSNVMNVSGATHPSTSQPFFYIGGAPTSGSNFKGILDDTRVYNSVLTADDVGLLYSVGGNVLQISFDNTGGLVFTNSVGSLTTEQITTLLDPTDTATGEASIVFDGDTTLQLSETQLASMETTTAGTLTESTVSFWVKPTSDTFANSNVILDYFATIGYTVTILPNGTLQFDVVDTTV